MRKKRLFLIDGTALAYRSYFAFIRNPLINSKGENTSAVFGFTNSILKIIKDENPDYIGVVFDTGKPTFRHEMYPEYKATREKMPDEMRPQLGRIKEVIEAFNIPVLEMEGFEADDVMGTLAEKVSGQSIDVFLVTGDKDFMQLVKPGIFVYNVKAGGKDAEILDNEKVTEKLGITPGQVIDLFGLMGDKSDNVPGIPGIGEKTALKLLSEFESLENILNNLESIKKESLRNKIKEFQDLAALSKKLVTIKRDVPVELNLKALEKEDYDRDALFQLFKELEFTSLLDKIAEKNTNDGKHYHLITTLSDLEELTENLKRTDFAFDLETTSSDPMRAEIVGFSFSFREGEAYYIPVKAPENSQTLNIDKVLLYLKPVMEKEKFKKTGQNAKYDIIILKRNGISVKGLEFDTMIASYLLNPGKHQHNLDSISMDYLNYKKISIKDLIGEGRKQISMEEVPVDKIMIYACEDADITLRLKNILYPLLEEQKIYPLFREIEIPLIDVLIEMEMNGIKLETGFLKNMSLELEKGLKQLEEEIYVMAGEEFNINSPQQLGKILYEKLEIHKEMGIKRAKKTKTGYSTDVATLERYKGLPLPKAILTYRTLMKLKSTYVDTLPKLINPDTGKVHTSFNQTVTATGRLSSSDPNLQNIPIRTKLGKEIRKAFVPSAPDGNIVSADYSQVELRLLAHLSQDETLLKSFKSGEDIHRRTASLIFDVPLEDVSETMRYKAKSINFGIIYGMREFRLSREIEISVEEARSFIESYFNNYPEVYNYLERQKELAQRNKYVVTLLGRRRYIPEIESDNQRIFQNALNIAVNTPIQGTAADLIKKAMINIHKKIKHNKLPINMILQIHDELVFEIPDDYLDEGKNLIRDEMENALELSVPLKVDIGTGKSWYEAH